MDINMYIRPDAFILVPVLFFIGLFLKQTPYIPEWSHAWIQLTFAVVACLLYYGYEIQSVVQGILVTGVAVISRDIIQHSLINYSQNNNMEEKKTDNKKNDDDKEVDEKKEDKE